jgi:integrase
MIIISFLAVIAEDSSAARQPTAPDHAGVRFTQQWYAPSGISDAERRRLLEAASKRFDRAFADALLTLFETGIRASELLESQRSDLDIDRSTLRVGRTSKARRSVSLSEPALNALARLAVAAPQGPLVRGRRGAAMTPAELNYRWRACCDIAGVERRPIYAIRHGFVSPRKNPPKD